MQEAISHAYQAGIEIGRAAAKQEMEQIAKITAAYANTAPGARVVGSTTLPANITRKWRETKSITPKTSPIASGVKKARTGKGPRTPGVKAAILGMITSQAMSAAAIIAKTGFKDTSVRGTLMTLKKDGHARNDDGMWISTATYDLMQHGNGEAGQDAHA